MAFLSGLLRKVASFLLPTVLQWIWEKVAVFLVELKNILVELKNKRAIEEKNKEAREGLEKGETPEERDRAAEDIARKF